MSTDTVIVDASKFQKYAGFSFHRWREVIGQEVTHFMFGLGIIEGFQPGKNGRPIIEIKFTTPSGGATKIPICSNHFVSEKFLELSLPKELVNSINQLCKLDICRIEVSEDALLHSFRVLLERFLFQQANEMICIVQKRLPEKEVAIYQQLLLEAKEQHVSKEIEEIKSYLEKYDYKQAQILYRKIQTYLSRPEFERLVENYKKRQARDEILSQIKDSFTSNNFAGADEKFSQSGLVTDEEYERLKIPYLQEYFGQRLKVNLSDEQAHALAIQSPDLLLKARAGSGKTTVISCKTALVIEKYGIDPDHVLILSFNRKAATEVKNRIRRVYGFRRFTNARTFHSLAYHLIRPADKLLFNSGGEFSEQAQSEFVKDILRKIWDPSIQEKTYRYFRNPLPEMEGVHNCLNDKEYYVFRRNLRQVSLRGEYVKSAGEKYIADFLFEHGLSYQYEKYWPWEKQGYFPDFTINFHGKEFILEHWGVNENDPASKPPEWWNIDREEYLTSIRRKRNYCKENQIPLIETSVGELSGPHNREAFEEILKSKLRAAGISCEKLPEKKLQESVIRKHVDRLIECLVQFIQRAKKELFTAQEMRRSIAEFHPDDQRTAVFLDLASRVFTAYEADLEANNNFDFEDLIRQAIEKINLTHGECTIPLRYNGREIPIKELEWILIDEYQDFSKLFYELIRTIRKFNPAVRLFCVGDDWQAINSFAGSNLRYFNRFEDFLPNGRTAHLLTNFRSREKVITVSNALMTGLGEPSTALQTRKGGEVIFEWIDNVWIRTKNYDNGEEEKLSQDLQFLFRAVGVKDNNNMTARYLKRCCQIIKRRDVLGKSVAILSRTNHIHCSTLNEFLHRLRQCLSPDELRMIGDFSSKIRIGSVHSFKGLEADIVILLNVCEGSFPLIHPDYALFRIFGETEQDILNEERRLFYVALTRAKEKLWILTEKGRESPFLTRLPGY